MERSSERLATARKALTAFQEVMSIAMPSAIERDAAIQRFEFTLEAVWKAAKHVLFEVEGVDVGSPKSAIRACRENGILTDEEAAIALEMVDDRNLSVHTYNEKLAADIYSRLAGYVRLLDSWIEGLTAGMQR